MSRYTLDFSQPSTRPRALSLLVLLIGAAAFILTLMHGTRLTTLEDRQRGELAQLEETARVASLPKPRAQQRLRLDAGEASQARILASLNFRWQTAFAALDAANNKNVALLSVEAAQPKKQLRIVAEARKLADALDYVGQLNAQPGVRRAVLQQHELLIDAEFKPVRFVVMTELRA